MISLNNLPEEMSKADFGDQRLSHRVGLIAEQISEDPDSGFPTICGSDSSLEAIYRFLGNPRVEPEKILAPHIQSTMNRIANCKKGLVIHDSSCFMLPGESDREGLQRFSKFKQGFWGHFALGVSHKGTHPLGVAGLHTFLRGKARLTQDTESKRWLDLVEEVEKKNNERSKLIHVMDREADNNSLLSGLVQNNRSFVIRVRKSRILSSIKEEGFQVIYQKQVIVSKRKDPGCPHNRQFHPPRESRNAKLTCFSSSVILEVPRRPNQSQVLLLNVVVAKEDSPPPGEKPVEWILFTTEPIKTISQVEAIIDSYQTRWLVEEFFKAIKTGCAFEKRQLESKKTLLNALAIFSPIAAQMLLLRSISRAQHRIALNTILTNTQIEVLKRFSKIKLPKRLGVQSALRAIAAMGGHLKSNGPPGWITLGRGYDKLMTLEMAWVAAKERCDR